MEIELVKLPVKFAITSNEDVEKYRSIYGDDWEPELKDGFKYFNLNQVCDFNEDDDGDVTLCMVNRDIKIYMKFEEFIKLSVFKILK